MHHRESSVINISLMSYGRSINQEQLHNRNGLYYETNKETPCTGEVIFYYENEKIHSKVNYKDGKANGEGIVYYENGQIRSKEMYKDGKLINKK